MSATTRKKRIGEDLPVFDAVRYLRSEAAIAEYIRASLEIDDPAVWKHALENAARARNQLEQARAAGLTAGKKPLSAKALHDIVGILGFTLDVRLAPSASKTIKRTATRRKATVATE